MAEAVVAVAATFSNRRLIKTPRSKSMNVMVVNEGRRVKALRLSFKYSAHVMVVMLTQKSAISFCRSTRLRPSLKHSAFSGLLTNIESLFKHLSFFAQLSKDAAGIFFQRLVMSAYKQRRW